MIRQSTTYNSKLWRTLPLYTFLLPCYLILSACSGYERSDYDPLSPEYTDTEETKGEEVDLGLSVNWASWNMGAKVPEEYGNYYAWGEIKPRNRFYKEDYIYYKNDNDYYDIGYDISGTKYDAAYIRWRDDWRMPTKEEYEELCKQCHWQWTTTNGINGYKIIGPNGNSIFLPAAGYRLGTKVYDLGTDGHYWSSTQNTIHAGNAYCLYFSNGYNGRNSFYRNHGYTIRPVKDKLVEPSPEPEPIW